MIDSILEERGKRYGEFEDNAEVAQNIKCCIAGGKMWDEMDDDQREALHQIATKISRIVTCDSNYKDNWEDIAGYAQLVAQRLETMIQ